MHASAPKVSVIVPAFRQAALIGGCLDSIRAQTYPGPIEVVVVDDGSPDDVGERAARHPVGAQVLRQENGGAAAARNLGIARASGDYLAFVNADDRWLPDKLGRQIAAPAIARAAALLRRLIRHVRPFRPGLAPCAPSAEGLSDGDAPCCCRRRSGDRSPSPCACPGSPGAAALPGRPLLA